MSHELSLCHKYVFVNGLFPLFVNRLQSRSVSERHSHVVTPEERVVWNWKRNYFVASPGDSSETSAPEGKKRVAQPSRGFQSVPAIVTAR